MLRDVGSKVITESQEMDTIQTEQNGADQTTAKQELVPGDDGFESLSMRFEGATLSPQNLTNRHEARLIGEFLRSSGVSPANSQNIEHSEQYPSDASQALNAHHRWR